ncbi:MAG: MerC domain-containing protein [Gammaproteobacteria bacterium]
MKSPKARSAESLDAVAVGISALCVIHCLATPLLVVVFPIIGGTLFANHAFHAWLLVLVLPTSTLALYFGYRRHQQARVLWLGAIGMGILTLAAVLGPEALTEAGERLTTSVGGIVLAIAHVLNFRRFRASLSACSD